MIEKTFNVEGMSRGHCKTAVEEKPNRLSGVENSNADFGGGTVEVRYDGSRDTAKDLKNAVESAGYTLTA